MFALLFWVAALPAQIAVVSDKLAGVLGCGKDEDVAASLNLRIKLNLSVPEVQQRDQEVCRAASSYTIHSFVVCKNRSISKTAPVW